jgi:hypothetical protein
MFFVLAFAIRVELHELPDGELVHSVLTARLDEKAFAFWGDRDGRDHVVDAEAAIQFPMQFPETATAFANLFKASGNQVAADAPATQSLSRAIRNVHCRFSFAAQSKSRITLSLCRPLATSPAGAAWWRLIRSRERAPPDDGELPLV